MDARPSRYHEVYARWQRDPQGFWGEAAADIDWFEKPKAAFDPKAGIYGRWFLGGELNTCYDAESTGTSMQGRGEQAAMITRQPGWTGTVERSFTYDASCTTRRGRPAPAARAGGSQGRPRHHLHADGAGSPRRDARVRTDRGDSQRRVRRVPRELATRINDAKPKLIVSASCGIEAKRVIPYKPLLDEAIQMAAGRSTASSCSGHRRPRPSTPGAIWTGRRR